VLGPKGITERPRSTWRALRVLGRSVVVLLAIVATARSAQAAPCGNAGRPWVSVIFTDGPWVQRFEEAVLGDLAAGLRRRDIDACREGAGPGQAPIAAVSLTRRNGTTVAVAVEVRDAVTEKRVSRELDLRSVPPDGQAFAIALATDELVWASWAELALKRKKPGVELTAPPQVIAGVEDALPEPLSRAFPARLGLRAAAERFLGGQTHLGGDAVLLLPLAPRFRLEVAAGYRHGLDVEAPHGSVSSRAVALGGSFRYLLLPVRPVELGVVLGARALWVRFEGRADGNERADQLEGVALYARAGLASALELGAGTWLELSAMSGAPLRGLEATDTGSVVAGVSGVEFAGSLAFLVEL
jgi:hypothetical protein